jgi:hypothetical protein
MTTLKWSIAKLNKQFQAEPKKTYIPIAQASSPINLPLLMLYAYMYLVHTPTTDSNLAHSLACWISMSTVINWILFESEFLSLKIDY